MKSQGQPIVASGSCPSGMFAHAAAGWVDTADSVRTYVSDVTVDSGMTSIALTARRAGNQPLTGKVIPFCVGQPENRA